MIEVISKNKAKHNGKAVTLKRASLKTYRGGQLYIRFFVGDTGYMGASLYRVNGKPYKAKKDRKNSVWGSSVPRKINTVYMEESRFANSIWHREYYTSDLGLTADYSKLYHFSNDAWNLLKELTNKEDRKTALMLVKGLSSEDATNEVETMMFERDLEDRRERIYFEDN